MIKGKPIGFIHLRKNWICTKEKNILDIRPSISLAKNIKRRDPVFALCNREVIEALSIQLFDMPKQS